MAGVRVLTEMAGVGRLLSRYAALLAAFLGAWAGDELGARLGFDLLRIGDFRVVAASGLAWVGIAMVSIGRSCCGTTRVSMPSCAPSHITGTPRARNSCATAMPGTI